MSEQNTPTQVSLIDGGFAKYCFDANIFFSFWVDTRRFPLEHYQPLWDMINTKIEGRLVTSTEEVYREIKEHNDATFQKWLASHKDYLYVKDDDKVIVMATQIINEHPEIYFQKPKNGADPFIVATAKVYKMTVVTEEIPATANELKGGKCPTVPNLCDFYDVPHVNILGFCQYEGYQLAPVSVGGQS